MHDARAAATYRAVFMSDLHLGSYRASAGAALAFLSTLSTQTLYLVGDIVDLWAFRYHADFHPDHKAVIKKLLDLARRGTRIVVIPGNHDGPLIHFDALGFSEFEIRPQVVFETAGGARLLVIHGHQRDPWFGRSGRVVGALYGLGEGVGHLAQKMRHSGRAGPRDEPRFKRLAARFEGSWVAAARAAHLDGVICGHSHAPADRIYYDNIRYLNCGDWLDNCTVVVETAKGELSLLRWRPLARTLPEAALHAWRETMVVGAS